MVTVRAWVSTLFIALATIIGSFVAFALRLIDSTGDRVLDLARLWSRLLLGFAGVKVTVDWRVPIDPNGRYVFMANHLSSVDIWSIYAAFPFRLRMIAKKQLARIPLFGWAMWAGRFIFIDRKNAVAARRSIEEAKRRIAAGQKVLLFPEGTRSRNGRLGPFKKGGFHLAIDAGVPIVPVAIRGAADSMPPGSLLLRRGHVHITVCPPIPTGGNVDRAALLERVRREIAAASGQELAAAPAELPGTDSAVHATSA